MDTAALPRSVSRSPYRHFSPFFTASRTSAHYSKTDSSCGSSSDAYLVKI